MNLVDRAKGIILNPNAEWQVIEREPGDIGGLLTGYIAILAAIPAVAGFIGSLLIGVGFFGALISAIISYVLGIVGVFVVAFIADALSPGFGGRKDFPSALKLIAYSYTPAWLAGIFAIIPFLGILSILGLYGIYLLYLGVPPMTKVPRDRAVVYTIVLIVCAIVLSVVISLIVAAIVFRSLMP